MIRSKLPNSDRSDHAFTLIELVIVVMILGVLSSVVIPALLPSADATAPAEPRKVTGVAPVRTPDGELPIYDRATIKATVSIKEHRSGTAVFARYTARFTAEFVVRPTKPDTSMRISIPFPKGAEEAEDITLALTGGGYQGVVDPQQVVVGIDGVHWHGAIAADTETLIARATFVAKGRGPLELRLPPSKGIRDLDVTVSALGFSPLPIPEDSLEPKRIDDDSYHWKYNNLVSGRPILIELPGAESPLGRVMFMLRLVGLAVFLFGIGFWYLAENYRPGHLGSFRWRHFLLLALTYSLFFAVFVVLGFQGIDPMHGLAIAAAASMPLLMWHVASVVDWRFAAKYTLPLASLTIGVVINGVYGGDVRSYVFLGLGAFAVAYMTFTVEGLAKKQQARRERIETDLEAIVEALSPLANELRDLDSHVSELLSTHDPKPLEPLREELKERTTETNRLVSEQRQSAAGLVTMKSKVGFERTIERENVRAAVRGLRESMLDAERRLREVLGQYTERRTQIEVERRETERARSEKSKAERAAAKARSKRGTIHCVACGHGSKNSKHCPECGTHRPLELTCAQCGGVFPLPVHLIAADAEPQPLHCSDCGATHKQRSSGLVVSSRVPGV
jgi:prepilin-type N-terminal cleavage/methylation domain-containing protein